MVLTSHETDSLLENNVPDPKNPNNILIGQRIKQARKTAGFNTAAQLLEQINHEGAKWGKGRLGNYEAGISQPSPDDITLIAKITQTSACWIMFGNGPIRARTQELQALRHQNLQTLVNDYLPKPAQYRQFLNTTGLSARKLEQHLLNPFLAITDKLARCCEKYARLETQWMDKHHLECDPALLAYPENMCRLMEIYSNLDSINQNRLLAIAEILDDPSSIDAHLPD